MMCGAILYRNIIETSRPFVSLKLWLPSFGSVHSILCCVIPLLHSLHEGVALFYLRFALALLHLAHLPFWDVRYTSANVSRNLPFDFHLAPHALTLGVYHACRVIPQQLYL